MANFDIEGARKAGYSDAEIADHLAQQSKFDVDGARKAGYSDAEIIQHVSPTTGQKQSIQKVGNLIPGMAVKADVTGRGTMPPVNAQGISNYTPAEQAEVRRLVGTWVDVPIEALKNTPKSAANFAGGMYHAVSHPIDTVNNVLDLGAGALHNVVPKPISDFIDKIDSNNPAAQKRLQESIEKADAVGQMYKDRYGSMEGVKNTLATDPVGVAADLSTILGAGAAVTPGKLSAALSKASNATNPLSIVGAAGRGINEATKSTRSAIAESLMQSALKPTPTQLKSGDAAVAVKTLLANGINPTKGGVEKLKTAIGETNEQIGGLIEGSTATVDKNKVMNALGDVREKFTKQVSPASDLNAIEGVKAGFEVHPMLQGREIPVQLAQQLKQGTYKVVNKKYGQLGSAEIEAQKALARGLKEAVAEAVPEVAALNAKESALIKTLDVTERRALMDLNKNPMGLSLLANNPASWAAFMADKSALFKSLAARLINPGAPSKMVQMVKDAGGATGITPEQAKLAALLASQAGNQE